MPALDFSLPAVRVIVRGWLNCNHVLLLSEAGNALIDTGYSSCAEETLSRLASPEYLGDRPLHRVINTHCHSDHMGGNAALLRRYGCAVTIPAGDANDIRPWNRAAFLIEYADHYIEPFDYSDTLAAGDAFIAGDLHWQAIAAPGHDMNGLVFWCEEQGILITGDALWENGIGAMFPVPTLDAAITAAHSTLDRIAALAPRWVIPGHGPPFADARGAVTRARRRLDMFAADPAKNARHVLKALLSFALLAKQGMRMSEVAPYCASVPAFSDLNERFIGKPPAALVNELVAELVKAQVVVIKDASIRSTMVA